MATNKTSEEEVRTSVSSIYSQLLDKRRSEKEAKLEKERLEREEKQKNDDGTRLTKEERRQASLDAWKEIVIGLTGDDLEYSKPKSKKKKYKAWIDFDENTITDTKPKKPKKRNYQKEFSPELNMLKTLLNDQNKFTNELQRRFQNAAGPATKDAMMPSKNLVDLASAVNSGRTNALGLLREIGGIKKTVAELYMKQRKLDADLAGASNVDNSDIGLLGSSIAESLFGSNQPVSSNAPVQQDQTNILNSATGQPITPTVVQPSVQQETPVVQAEVFDPDNWDGPELDNDFTKFENVPHEVIIERNRNTGNMRYMAINTETGEELADYDLPTNDPNKLQYNEKDGVVKGQFDEVYKVKEV